MAKKRHHSHEAHGNPKGHDKMGHEMYAGPLQKRRLEMMDGNMIHEDHNAMANLPQEVKMAYWPKAEYSTYDLDDTIRGIDKQQSADSRRDERRDAFMDGNQ